MSLCLSNLDFVAYDDGMLDASRAAGVREHLKICDTCRSAFERFHNQPAQTIESPASRWPVLEGSIPSPAPSPTGPDDAVRHYPKIDGYRILGVLGQGGMGIVYRAEEIGLDRIVALKVLPAIVADRTAVALFEREAKAAARMHHIHIVPVYHFGESHDGPYYAMELIDGKPLNELIIAFARQNISTASPARLATLLKQNTTGTPLARDDENADETIVSSSSGVISSSSTGRGRAYFLQVAHWMADAADALHYAHGQDITHRDIKPGNMILSTDGRIMITDFGLAKCKSDQSLSVVGVLRGAIRYMSPEQAMAGHVRIDHRTDIWSLGATMYELLTFVPAFPGTDSKEVLAAIITKDPTPPRKIAHAVPSALETICLKALEKSPDDRYATARALAEQLWRYINDLPIDRTGLVRRIIKFIKRHKAPVIAATAVVMLSAMGALLLWEVTTGRQERIDKYLANAQQLKNQNNWDEADAAVAQAILIDPGNSRSLLTSAWLKLEYFAAHRAEAGGKTLQDAEDACRQVLQQDPRNTRALNYLGVVLRRSDRYVEAVVPLGRACELAPADFSNWSNLGVVYAATHDLDKANELLTKGAELAGVDKQQGAYRAIAWRNLAVLELYLKKPEAFEHITNALACYDKDASTWVLRARAELELPGRYNAKTAREDAGHADRLANFEDPKAKRILAAAYLQTGDYDSAVAEAQQAVKLNDMEAVNRLLIAAAEAKRGRVSAAREALATAESSWPDGLRKPGEYTASAETGDLWIESADGLIQLKIEAGVAIAAASGSPP